MRGIAGALFILACACGCGSAGAAVFKCVGADGTIAFQDQPCARGQRQSTVDVPSRGPPDPGPAPALSVPAPDAAPTAVPAYVPPPAPLPALYACVGAVNGKRYLSQSVPPPYLAPLGVMGYPPLSLAEAYGPSHHVGNTMTGGAKPPVGGPAIGAGMTEVQDYCQPASQAEVCSFVQKQYDENHRRLRMAMRREQPPLEQREQELQDQLRNCR